MKEKYSTARNQTPENPRHCSTPTNEKLKDGQYQDHWVLSEEERSGGYIRPIRTTYRHIGKIGPKYKLRDLTEEEYNQHRNSAQFNKYSKFEEYPEGDSCAIGRYWSLEDLNAVDRNCGVVTSMPMSIAETYAKNPKFYGSTFCVGCQEYFPVEEFVWDDGSDERLGT